MHYFYECLNIIIPECCKKGGGLQRHVHRMYRKSNAASGDVGCVVRVCAHSICSNTSARALCEVSV